MIKKPNTKLIGLFTIVSISVFFIIIASFLSSKIFELKEDQMVMFFNESIKGLNVGSPVAFRGVEIGRVSKIDLIPDKNDKGFTIPVFVEINKNQNFRVRQGLLKDNKLLIEDLVKTGLKAKLHTQSLLTGQLMIELEMLPHIEGHIQKNYPFKNVLQVPTILSPIGELSQGLQDLPIKDIIHKFDDFLVEFNRDFPIALQEVIKMSRNVNKASIAVNNIVKKIDKTMVENSNDVPILMNNFNKTLINTNNAINSLKNLLDYLERHPESILKGKQE